MARYLRCCDESGPPGPERCFLFTAAASLISIGRLFFPSSERELRAFHVSPLESHTTIADFRQASKINSSKKCRIFFATIRFKSRIYVVLSSWWFEQSFAPQVTITVQFQSIFVPSQLDFTIQERNISLSCRCKSVSSDSGSDLDNKSECPSKPFQIKLKIPPPPPTKNEQFLSWNLRVGVEVIISFSS